MKDLESIPDELTKLEDGRECLLLNQVVNNSRILLFMPPNAEDILSNCCGLQMDGTFYTCPSGFSQIYLIFGVGEDHTTYPVLYGLLPSKDAPTYTFMLQALKQAVPSFTPEFIIIDFKAAMIDAILQEFPGACLSGCHFHFKQVGTHVFVLSFLPVLTVLSVFSVCLCLSICVCHSVCLLVSV